MEDQSDVKEVVGSDVADSEVSEQIDTKTDTETTEEQVSKEKSEDTPTDSEVLGPIDSESATEILDQKEVDQEVLESGVAGPEESEPIDTESDAETPQEQVPEKELEDVVNASEEFGPIGPIKNRVKKRPFVRILLTVVLLVSVIGTVAYFMFPVKLQRLYNNLEQQIATNKDKKVTEVPKAIPAQPSAEDSDFSFRNTRWGMTLDQVKASETMKIEREDDTSILYHSEVAGLKATIYYTFREGILIGSMHHFTEEHNDDNNYIIDYKKVKDTLTREYGPPIMDEQLWNNDQNKSDPQKWGDAVRSGSLILRSSWEFKDTVIGSGLYGNNDEIIHGVFYTTKEFEHLLKQD